MNKCFFSGRFGREPDMSYTQNGMAVLKFSLAVDLPAKDKDGKWSKRAIWPNFVAFGKTAEVLNQYCRKGDSITAIAAYSPREYQDKEGVTRMWHEFIVDSFEFGAKARGVTQEPAPDDLGELEDIPF